MLGNIDNNIDNVEKEESFRVRKVTDNRYIPKGLINAYLQNRMKAKDRKRFELLFGDAKGLQEQLRIKTEVYSFMKELIPKPKISKQRASQLGQEMADITNSIIGDEQKTIKEKISSFLDKTIIEF